MRFDKAESLFPPDMASISLAGMVGGRKTGKGQANFLSRFGVEVGLSIFS